MPRKPPVPTIPDKPSGRAKPEHSPEVPKHSTELSLDQFDLWDAFAGSLEERVGRSPKGGDLKRSFAAELRSVGSQVREQF